MSRRLRDEPYRFGFFQAVRLLHALAPERRRIGGDGPPRREALRLTAEQSLAFPASEVLDVGDASQNGASDPADGPPPRMQVRFMGLTGPMGALPRHYTDLIVARASRMPDDALPAFLDLLNHRLISLFFRAWEKYRPALRLDSSGRDELDGWFFALLGLGTRGLRARLAVDDRVLLFYTGLLAQRPRSALGLECLLTDYFGAIPVRIDQFRGQWLQLPEDSLTHLERHGTNNLLGVDAVLGSRVWHTQSRFRVCFGPLGWDEFQAFLPCGDCSRPALELTRFWAGTDQDVEFQVSVRAEQVRPCRLDSTDACGMRLGWSTWLAARAVEADTEEPVLDGRTIVAWQAAKGVASS